MPKNTSILSYFSGLRSQTSISGPWNVAGGALNVGQDSGAYREYHLLNMGND